MKHVLRRDFVFGLVAAAAGATLPLPLRRAHRRFVTSVQDQLDPARALLRRHPSFDLHMHPGLFPLKDIPNSANPRECFGDDAVAERIRQMDGGHLGGGFFSMVLDAPLLGGRRGKVRDFANGEGWAEYKRQLAVLEDIVADPHLEKATTARAVGSIHGRGHTAAVFACEGGDHLEGRPQRVEELFADGVRHVQPFHVAGNPLVVLDTGGRDAGLSAPGKDVVREMNRLGMVVDMGHASFATTKDAADVSTAPLIQSHSLVRTGGRGFGITPDHARLIAETGGVIGAFGGTPNRDIPGYVANILAMIEAVGIDHVGLGSDMDGTGGQSVWDDYKQVPVIVAGLLAAGLAGEDVAKAIGGNALRVLGAVER